MVNSMTPTLPSQASTSWNWPMPEYLPVQNCLAIDAMGGGNCLFAALLICIGLSDTLLNCGVLRRLLSMWLLSNSNVCLSPHIPLTVSEWAYGNLTEQNKLIWCTHNPLYQYALMIQEVTPHSCEYGSLLEAFAFSRSQNVNLVVYEETNDCSSYKITTSCFVGDNVATVCLLYLGGLRMHYQALMPVVGQPLIVAPPRKISNEVLPQIVLKKK